MFELVQASENALKIVSFLHLLDAEPRKTMLRLLSFASQNNQKTNALPPMMPWKCQDLSSNLSYCRTSDMKKKKSSVSSPG